MERKSGSESSWIFFGVITAVTPTFFAIVPAFTFPNWESMLDSCLLVVFSVACNSVSVSYQAYKLHKDRTTMSMCCVSAGAAFCAWCLYIFALAEKIQDHAKVIDIACIIAFALLCCIGVKAAKMSDNYENKIIEAMHENCDKIRSVLVSKRNNKKLESHVVRSDDLLCNPREFDRVEKILEGIK